MVSVPQNRREVLGPDLNRSELRRDAIGSLLRCGISIRLMSQMGSPRPIGTLGTLDIPSNPLVPGSFITCREPALKGHETRNEPPHAGSARTSEALVGAVGAVVTKTTVR
jgi:hypothetical protein